MKLLPEYALLHEVFAAEKPMLAYLRDAILDHALVRDLRGGEWSRALRDFVRDRPSLLAREIVESLVKNNQLSSFPSALSKKPANERDWCDEALDTHRQRVLEAIIVGCETAQHYKGRKPVVGVDAIAESRPTARHTVSVRPRYRISEYLAHLELVLAAARRVCFIDPYIDPAHRDYQDFPQLLLRAGQRTPHPRIEIHRKCSYGNQFLKSESQVRPIFGGWDRLLAQSGVKVRVVIWDDFKVRYLLSDIIGLHVAKGFKTNNHPSEVNVWNRLSRTDREDVDREFDENSPSHTSYCTFEIGSV